MSEKPVESIMCTVVLDKEKGEVMRKMEEHFQRRTTDHIRLFRKYLCKIKDLNLPELDSHTLTAEINTHDEGKWLEPEYTPYLYITWKYYQERIGNKYEIPEDIKSKAHEATYHHIKTHRHHPEYWDDNTTIECLNQVNRDKPAGRMVDATHMPPSYIASMVADWLAVSEERKSDVNDWIKMNVNIRWRFTDGQVSLIKKLVEEVQKPHKCPGCGSTDHTGCDWSLDD